MAMFNSYTECSGRVVSTPSYSGGSNLGPETDYPDLGFRVFPQTPIERRDSHLK
jgi:hypothetical protein